MARDGRRSRRQQAEGVVEALLDLFDPQHLHALCGELDRQRDAIEPLADPPRASRVVARIDVPLQLRRIVSATSAQASITCSRLSKISSAWQSRSVSTRARRVFPLPPAPVIVRSRREQTHRLAELAFPA
jgi:hypothetical protein